MAKGKRRNCLWVLVFLAICLPLGWSQAGNDEASADQDAKGPTQAVPEDGTVPQNDAEPQAQTQASYSTAGMGIPSAEAPRRNYLLFGITGNESVQYAPANNFSGPNATNSVTRVFGSVDYLRTKGRYQTSIDYRGGGFFFVNSDFPDSTRQVQQLSAQQRISWNRTKLFLTDSLSNFPGGNFGAGWFGGTSAYNLGLPPGTAPTGTNVSNFFGFDTFGGLGQANYFTNVALAEVTQEVTPRSALTFSGAYALTDHIGNEDFISSRQATAAVSYNYMLTHRSTIGVFYGYQDIRFVGGDSVMTNTVQGTFQHSISSRTGFILGGGPQFIRFNGPVELLFGSTPSLFTTTNHQTGASAFASVSHSLQHSSLAFSYNHQVTNGSGIFAGASSDIAQFTYGRALSRLWGASFDAGFVRLSSIGNNSSGLLGNSYSYGFVGAAVQRKIGQRFSFYASYQFNDENYDRSSCAVTSNCSGLVGRHVAVVGIAWRSRPVVFGDSYDQNPGVQPVGSPPAVAP